MAHPGGAWCVVISWCGLGRCTLVQGQWQELDPQSQCQLVACLTSLPALVVSGAGVE